MAYGKYKMTNVPLVGGGGLGLQGPYRLPRTSGGRVPPTRHSGRLSEPPVPRRGGSGVPNTRGELDPAFGGNNRAWNWWYGGLRDLAGNPRKMRERAAYRAAEKWGDRLFGGIDKAGDIAQAIGLLEAAWKFYEDGYYQEGLDWFNSLINGAFPSLPQNYAGYRTSYWCTSRNLTCLGGNPFAIEYRTTAAVPIPTTCPSICTNTGARWATFPLASANGTAAQVRRVTNQLTGSVYAQWEKIANGGRGLPMPMPYRIWPTFYPKDGPHPEPMTAPLLEPHLRPASRGAVDIDGRLVVKPSVRPSVDIDFSADGAPPRITPGEHADKPDKAGKRYGVPPAMVAAIKLMHGLTELGDFFGALYDALPPIARCAGKRGLMHDALCVLEHMDAYADPEVAAAAIGNLIAEGVEDKVIGSLFGASDSIGGRPYTGTAWVGGGYGAPSIDAGYGGLTSTPYMSPM